MSSVPERRPLKDSAVASLAGRACWIISDGKAGHEAQSLGVAEALGLDVVIKPVSPKGLFQTLSPFVPVAPHEKFGSPKSIFSPPWPDVAISAGRLTAPYMRALKRHAGAATFTVMLLDPKIGTSSANVLWVPAHDQKTGHNVISTLTPPHRHSPSSLALLRDTPAPFTCEPTQTKVVVLLGGPNGRYVYSEKVIARFVTALRSLTRIGATLLVTASRRTPAALVQAVKTVVNDSDGYFWDGLGENPIAHFYARGDVFIAPADSINMTAEPCVTGRPVYVFHPDGGSEKFTRFHRALEDFGATRRLPDIFTEFESWSYPPLFASETIADEIVRRWSETQN